MRKLNVKFIAVTAAAIGIVAILSSCSQGYTSGSPAPKPTTTPAATNPVPATTQPALAGPSSKSSTIYRNRVISPAVSGTTVTLPMDEIVRNGMESFNVKSDATTMTFMAYQLDGQYYVRAALCVPCGSRSFTLQNGKLICDSCRTVFNGATGVGMSGVSACMSYAKKAATYTAVNGNLVVNTTDLATAYQNTLNRR